jgi:hypothetical protein
MAFDDSSMVQRFQNAVEALAGVGAFQERLEAAFRQLIPLRFEAFPAEAAGRFRPIHEALERGLLASEVTDEQAPEIAKVIVDVSHLLAALYAETMATQETQLTPKADRGGSRSGKRG